MSSIDTSNVKTRSLVITGQAQPKRFLACVDKNGTAKWTDLTVDDVTDPTDPSSSASSEIGTRTGESAVTVTGIFGSDFGNNHSETFVNYFADGWVTVYGSIDVSVDADTVDANNAGTFRMKPPISPLNNFSLDDVAGVAALSSGYTVKVIGSVGTKDIVFDATSIAGTPSVSTRMTYTYSYKTATEGFSPGSMVLRIVTEVENQDFAFQCKEFTETNLRIDWGDDTEESLIEGSTDAQLTHTFAEPSTYFIQVEGQALFTKIGAVASQSTLREVLTWGVTNTLVMGSGVFKDNTQLNLTNVNGSPNLATDVSSLFENCTDLSRINNIQAWEVGSVQNFSSMFKGCRNFNPTTLLSRWKVDSATTFSSMFSGCTLLSVDLSDWDVSNVTDFSFMFEGCLFLAPSSVTWTVSSGTTFEGMFSGCASLNASLVWDMTSAENTSRMFQGCSFFNNISVVDWDVSNVTDFSLMFENCTSFNRLIGGEWNVSSGTTFSGMFSGCRVLNQPFTAWLVNAGVKFSNMFRNCVLFVGPLNWGAKVASGENFSGMFSGCAAFNDPAISSWSISANATNLSSMFANCILLNQSLGTWNVSNVTNFSNMFSNCLSLDQGSFSQWDVRSAENMELMFVGCTLDFTNYDAILLAWSANEPVAQDISIHFGVNTLFSFNALAAKTKLEGTDNWTIIDGGMIPIDPMSFTTISIGSGDTFTISAVNDVTNATIDWGDMTSDNITVFNDPALTHTYADADAARTITILGTITLDKISTTGQVAVLNNWGDEYQNITLERNVFEGNSTMNADSVEGVPKLSADMYGFFRGCAALTTINGIEQWDTSGVTVFSEFFFGCTDLVIPSLNGWDVSSGTDFRSMFIHCTSFNGSVSDWDISSGVEFGSMFDSCTSYDGNGLSSWGNRFSTDVSDNLSFTNMFWRCGVFNEPINSWQVSRVTDFSFMFFECSIFNQPLDLWDVANAVTLEAMFMRCSLFDQVLDWEVFNVITFKDMFNSCTAFNNGNDASIGNWTLDSATDLSGMFLLCASFNQSLNTWNVTAVTDFSRMFFGCSIFNQSVLSWETNVATNLSGMFRECSQFNQPVNHFITGSVTDFFEMFFSCVSFNQTIVDWDITVAETMEAMMIGCTLDTAIYDNILTTWAARPSNELPQVPPLGSFLVHFGNSRYNEGTASAAKTVLESAPYSWTITDGGVIPIGGEPFQVTVDRVAGSYEIELADVTGAVEIDWGDGTTSAGVNGVNSHAYAAGTPVTVSITAFGVGNSVTITSVGVTMDTTSILSWGIDRNILFSGGVFNANTELTADGLNISGIPSLDTDMSQFFKSCNTLTTINNVNLWNTSTVANMNEFFTNCSNFNDPLINSWNVSNTTNFTNMFRSCIAFAPILIDWDVESALTMESMFFGCTSFNANVHSWRPLLCTQFNNMFEGCTSFTGRGLEEWNVSSGSSFDRMFFNCTDFISPVGQWNVSSATILSEMFGICESFNENLNDWDVSAVTTFELMFVGCDSLQQSFEDWTIRGSPNMAGMFSGCDIGPFNYEATLKGWWEDDVSTGLVPDTITISFGNTLPTIRAAAYRQLFRVDKTWTITDGGVDNSDVVLTGDEFEFNVNYTVAGTFTVTANDDPLLDIAISWGDGNYSLLMPGDNTVSHSYTVSGDYTVHITGTGQLTKVGGTGSETAIQELVAWPNVPPLENITFSAGCFNGNANLTAVSVQRVPLFTNNAINEMFQDCTSLTTINNIESWPVSTIENFSSMFSGCTAFNDQQIENWNVSSGTTFAFMFSQCSSFDKELNWSLSSAETVSAMFSGCSLLRSSINFTNTSNITNFASTFSQCTLFNSLSVGSWNVSGGTTFALMFSSCTNFNQNLSRWNVSNAQILDGMFLNCTSFNPTIPFNTVGIAATSLSQMFEGCTSVRLDGRLAGRSLSDWNVSSVTNFSDMFKGCTSFSNGTALSSWTVSSGLDFSGMFEDCTSFTGNLSNWNVSSATTFDRMFLNNGDTKVTIATTFDNWQIGTVTSMIDMFLGCTFTIEKYDSLLVAWAAQTVQSGVEVHFGLSSNYSPDGEVGRDILTGAPNNWTINDGVLIDLGNPMQLEIQIFSLENNNYRINVSDVVDATVIWGDSFSELYTPGTTFFSHTYEALGTYTVSLTGNFKITSLANSSIDYAKVRSLVSWGSQSSILISGNAFVNLSAMTSPVSPPSSSFLPNFSVADGLSSCFKNCTNAEFSYAGEWDVAGITNLREFLRGCTLFNIDVSGWNVSSVQNLEYIFLDCNQFNRDVGAWDVSSCTAFQGLFGRCSSLSNFTPWSDMSSARNLSTMFESCINFNVNLNSWGDTLDGALFMQAMFIGCSFFNQPLDNWASRGGVPISSCRTFSRMFQGCTQFNQLATLNAWAPHVSAGEDFSFMFTDCVNLPNANFGDWDVSAGTNFNGMFQNCANIDQSFVAWGTGNRIKNVNPANNGGMRDFLSGVTLTPDNYSDLLIAWEASVSGGAPGPDGVIVNFGEQSNWQLRADAARRSLVNNHGWTITDGRLLSTEMIVEMEIQSGWNGMGIDYNTFGGAGSITVDWGNGDAPVTRTTGINMGVGGLTVGATHIVKIAGTNVTIRGIGPIVNLKRLTSWGQDTITLDRGVFGSSSDNVSNNRFTIDVNDGTTPTFSADMTGFLQNQRNSSLIANAHVEDWDVSPVTNFTDFFRLTQFQTANISSWDVSNGTNFNRMFEANFRFNTPLTWSMPNAVDLTSMFGTCMRFNSALNFSSLSSATTFDEMFQSCFAFNQFLNWSMPVGQTYTNMFLSCVSLTKTPLVVPGSATNISRMLMFCDTYVGDSNMKNWDFSSMVDCSSLFRSCSSLVGGANLGWNTVPNSTLVNVSEMFKDCVNLESSGASSIIIAFNNKRLNRVTDASGMFENCVKFTGIASDTFVLLTFPTGVHDWELDSLVFADQMFSNCRSFRSYVTGSSQDDEGGITSALTSVSEMFQNCTSMNFNNSGIDWARRWAGYSPLADQIGAGVSNTVNITDFSRMFRGCGDMTNCQQSFHLWITDSATNMTDMFRDCTFSTGRTFNEGENPLTTYITYNDILVGWNNQVRPANINVNMGTQKFGGAGRLQLGLSAVRAHRDLQNQKNWVIIDGGEDITLQN